MSTHDLSVGGKPVSAANPIPVTGGSGGGGGDTTTLGAAVPAVAVLTAYQDPNGNVATAKVDANGYQIVTGVGVAQSVAIAGVTLSPIGMESLSATPTRTTAQVDIPVLTLEGAQVQKPYALADRCTQGSTAQMTGTAATAVTGIGAPAAGLFNYITGVIVSNAHATVGTEVVLCDGAGGTAIPGTTMPAAPAYGGCVMKFDPPIKQTTAATALYAKNLTTGAAVTVSAVGYQAK